jgi:phosphatidyl-myo-inositol dimannoside synthase
MRQGPLNDDRQMRSRRPNIAGVARGASSTRVASKNTGRPLKILLTGYRFDVLGGLEIVSAAIAKMLADAGHHVQCAAVHGHGVVDKDGYRIIGTAPSTRVARSLAYRVPMLYPMRELRRLAAWADLIIAVHCHTLPKVFSAVAPLQNPPPVVAWLHGREVWGIEGDAYAEFLKRADRLVAVSRYTADLATTLLGTQYKPEVIYNPVDTGYFRPLPQSGGIARHSILTVGRLGSDTEHKGYDMLLKALAILQRRRPELPLTLRIVGGGARLPVMQTLANDLNVSPRVEFTGSIPRSQLAHHYATCDIFAFPSKVMKKGSEYIGEGFGVVNIEAAASGRPVLTSTHGGCPETIIPNVTGMLIDPTREEAIADGIESMFRLSPEDRDQMGERGRRFVAETFAYEAISDRIASVVSVQRSGRSGKSLRGP